MSNKLVRTILATLFIATVMGVCVGFYAGQTPYYRLINQCESELPRSQNCVLVAIPEGERE